MCIGYKDGVTHRIDGPAVEMPNGTKMWWVDGKRHRLDGPAVVKSNGRCEWYVDGKRHRLDGPAVENPDGSEEWYVDDQYIDVLAIFGYLPSVPLSTEEQMIMRLSV